ncbi:MFS transporter [Aquibium sp. LZ166]|uniref:MFS transporter n=1 Tax=Aquibium pacificus TaxID=3153579 RepID=A0ABV3SQS6_9HYPH
MSFPPLTPEQSVKPPRFEARMSLLFAAIFVPMGIHLPYFPLWLEERGFTAGQVGLILSAPIFVRLIAAPAITALADRAPERAYVLIGLAAASLVASLGYFLPAGPAFVLAVSLILSVVWSPHSPLADSLALSGVRRYGVDYSRLRIWGTGSFLAANLVGGAVLARFDAGVVPWMLSAGLAGTLAAALAAPRLGRPRRPSQLAAELPDARRVLSEPYFLAIAFGCGSIVASHGFLYAFGSIYWRSLGIASDTVGFLWALMVLAEMFLLFGFRRLFSGFSVPAILAVCAGAAVLRWVAMPLVWPLGLGLAGFGLVQGLHAFSTGLTMLGLQKMIAETIPEERTGAAQGVAFAANSGGMALVTLASGPLYDHAGAFGFLAMAAISAVGLVLSFAAYRLAPERRRGR